MGKKSSKEQSLTDDEPRPENIWSWLIALQHEIFSFMKSRSFMVMFFVGVVAYGAVNMEQLRELGEIIKGLFSE